ncbi:hypothetical protein, partial [Anaerovibrio sp.]|uniref:hypothetical protein n=1 Tax=Anaerovibrio sp. TaxID=1872532 RepID=UPI00388F324A
MPQITLIFYMAHISLFHQLRPLGLSLCSTPSIETVPQLVGQSPEAAHFNQGSLVFKSVGGLLRTPLFYNLFISNLDLSHIIYPKYSEGVS